jgi:hypothetical protein
VDPENDAILRRYGRFGRTLCAVTGPDDFEEVGALPVEDAIAQLLAVDKPTPDLPLHRQPPDFDWSVHHLLLSHGTLIAEQPANLRFVSCQRVEFLLTR